ncbi:MAG: hypothetical protein IPJ06_01950 [Saprospiraceae bacterium]|nr:hypothetical protein [Saprospiraceae bacterium]
MQRLIGDRDNLFVDAEPEYVWSDTSFTERVIVFLKSFRAESGPNLGDRISSGKEIIQDSSYRIIRKEKNGYRSYVIF